MGSDCADDGECFEEVTFPCCGYAEWNDSRNAVTPTLDEFGYPIEEQWMCMNSNSTDLCPDRFDGSRIYETTHKIEWFLDGDTDSIVSRCGCLYETDECDIPTTNPTMDPTRSPTEIPTPEPTEYEGDSTEGADMVFVRIALMVALLAALFI